MVFLQTQPLPVHRRFQLLSRKMLGVSFKEHPTNLNSRVLFAGICSQMRIEFDFLTPVAQLAERLDLKKNWDGILDSNPDEDITCNF